MEVVAGEQRIRLIYHKKIADKDDCSSFSNKASGISEQKWMAGSEIHRIQWQVPYPAGSMDPLQDPDLNADPSHSY